MADSGLPLPMFNYISTSAQPQPPASPTPPTVLAPPPPHQQQQQQQEPEHRDDQYNSYRTCKSTLAYAASSDTGLVPPTVPPGRRPKRARTTVNKTSMVDDLDDLLEGIDGSDCDGNGSPVKAAARKVTMAARLARKGGRLGRLSAVLTDLPLEILGEVSSNWCRGFSVAR